ncbi:MAG TPA: helix-turn-helix domain-containing protein [Myxococcota bacterium]|nr:helix-turn-helix domain-containing protein [Myxococcota bacterium]
MGQIRVRDLRDSWRLLHWRSLPTLRPREVALISGLGEQHVRRLIDSGELESRRVGRAVLVPVRAVVGLLGEGSPGELAARPPCLAKVEREAADVLRKLRAGNR